MSSVSLQVKWVPLAVMLLLATACDATGVDLTTSPVAVAVGSSVVSATVATAPTPPEVEELLAAYLDDPSVAPPQASGCCSGSVQR